VGEPFQDLLETEVCTVRVGSAGLFLAKELAERNCSALIIEARRVGRTLFGDMEGFAVWVGLARAHKLKPGADWLRPRPYSTSLAKAFIWSRIF
jgi:hypothetical protein